MSGTWRRLLRLWIGMLVVTAVAIVGAVVSVDLGRRDANALREGEAPAREGLAAARASLTAADTVMITEVADAAPPAGADAVDAGEDRAAAPPDEFFSAINAANQHLSQVSQADIGGPAGEEVQVVQGLLITYISLVQQAFRYEPGSLLSGAYVQYAHRFLDNEVLGQLTVLEGRVAEAAPRRPPWGRHLLWAVALLVLAGMLVRTQVWSSRHFRRTLSVPLVAASALVLVFGVTAVLSLDVDRDISAGRAGLTTLVRAYKAQELTARGQACVPLRAVSENWPPPRETCAGAVPADEGRDLLTMANGVITTGQSAAAAAGRNTVVLVVVGLLIGTLITVGLLPRLEEYRFRRR